MSTAFGGRGGGGVEFISAAARIFGNIVVSGITMVLRTAFK